jgi:hypothetical protein
LERDLLLDLDFEEVLGLTGVLGFAAARFLDRCLRTALWILRAAVLGLGVFFFG